MFVQWLTLVWRRSASSSPSSKYRRVVRRTVRSDTSKANGYPGSGPTLVCLEQDAGPGHCLGQTPARPDHPFEPSLFLDTKMDPVNIPHRGCHQLNFTPKNSIQDQTIRFVRIRLSPSTSLPRPGPPPPPGLSDWPALPASGYFPLIPAAGRNVPGRPGEQRPPPQCR